MISISYYKHDYFTSQGPFYNMIKIHTIVSYESEFDILCFWL